MKFIVLLFICLSAFAEDGADAVALLRQSQSDESKLVPAIQALTAAIGVVEKAQDENKALELNACLFWARKKLNLAEIEQLTKVDGEAAKRADSTLTLEVKPADAALWLAKADGFANVSKDQFLIAVRYFEVASRFKGSFAADTAMEKSMAALQKAKVPQGVVEQVVGKADTGTGKVFVQSIPTGASILVRQTNELRDTGAKTPGMVALPKGSATLVLRKEGFVDGTLQVVAGDAIIKPDVVTLEPPRVEVEVTSADPGWRIFVDGKPLKDKLGKRAETPCTVMMPLGTYNLGWAKDGFADIVERVTVSRATSALEVKTRPQAGKSVLLAIRRELVVGYYKGIHPSWKHRLLLAADGVVHDETNACARWELQGETLVLNWFHCRSESLSYDRATGRFVSKIGFSLTPE
jgi:hypothetical protein